MLFKRNNLLAITATVLIGLIFSGLAWPSGIAAADNGSQPSAAPESSCNKAPDPAGCKKDYKNCGRGNSSTVIDCKNKVIGDNLAQTLPQVNPNQSPQQNVQNINQANAQNANQVKFNQGIHNTTRDVCGGTVNGQDESVAVAIKIGCKGKGNPIADATFAIIRILSDGVGLVVIGSIIVGGIQYAGSRGDPQATALAVGRIRSSLFALLLFIFGYAILNYLIPAGFLG